MFEKLKNSVNKMAKESVRSYIEGRHDIDAASRRALDILDLPYDSDFETIKNRYYSLSKQFHPDSSNTADQEKFIAVKEAYDVLKSHFKT
ncbi:MAG: hypothetical protein DRG24_00850 [Epsilonproteobacteria bacterium]|nr:MAG: hypothetical protein DRG24_00850 [Campylobacterota bacterium]